MIDFKKLEYAYKLADDYRKKFKQACSVDVEVMFYASNDTFFVYKLWAANDNCASSFIDRFDCIDLLITGLKRLIKTQQEKNQQPKYKFLDLVWFENSDGMAEHAAIKDIAHAATIQDAEFCNETMYQLAGGGPWRLESQLFKTKGELIDAQVAMWLAQRDD